LESQSQHAEDTLRRLFAAFWHTGSSRGFAFVEMAHAEDGNKAMAARSGTLLDERALNINEARSKKDPGSFRDRGYENRRGGRRW
jgi:RNA recognition motif-containing protein